MILSNKLFFLFLIFCCLVKISAQVVINEIIFRGNENFTAEELRSQIRSHAGEEFDQRTANADVQLLLDFYKQKGFYHIKINSPQIETLKEKKLNLIFKIEVTEEPEINEVYLNGTSYISKKKIRDELIAEKPNLSTLPNYIKAVVDFYADRGFLFAQVQIDSLRIADDMINVHLGINEGKYCGFENYRARGNKVTKERTLLKISRLQSAEKINPDILEIAAENIRRKQYIKECEIFPVDHETLLFEVTEDRMSLISGILGYNDDPEKKQNFTGFFNIDFLNLFGTDRSISFNWESLTADRSYLEFSYHEAGFYRYPFSADITIARTEYDSTYIKNQLEAAVYYYDIFNKYGIFYGQDDIIPGSRKENTIEKDLFRRIGFFWERNAVDHYLNPRRGTRYDLRYYYIFSQQEEKNITKQALEFGWKYYFPLKTRWVFHTAINGKIIENKSLKEIEYFQLGGNQDLRGFTEEQFSGYRISWTNFELRYLLGKKSRVFLFTDHGFVENHEFRLWKLFGFGLGLRTQTKLGILGIDYGFGFDGEELRNPLDGIIHFGIETKL